jgi:hypothetical protein
MTLGAESSNLRRSDTVSNAPPAFALCFALICFDLLWFDLLCFALLCFALLRYATLCYAHAMLYTMLSACMRAGAPWRKGSPLNPDEIAYCLNRGFAPTCARAWCTCKPRQDWLLIAINRGFAIHVWTSLVCTDHGLIYSMYRMMIYRCCCCLIAQLLAHLMRCLSGKLFSQAYIGLLLC